MTTTIILPVKNEEKSVARTICDVKSVCSENRIIVVDGQSTDDTTFYAGNFNNVEIIYDKGIGKGAALRQAFEHCAPDDVVFVDADCTYEVDRIKEFVDALDDGYDVVVGRKCYTKNVKPRVFGIGLYYIGDYIWKVAFKLFYGKWTANNISGYRGISRRALDIMQLEQDGFGIETEIEIKSIRVGLSEKVIDTVYDDRVGKSKFMLKDNLATSKAFFKYMFWMP
jgi:dolichol-phosphate mannosyltransferase